MIKPRDFQQATLDALIENYYKGIRRNLAVLSTGAGKTFLITLFNQMFNPEEKMFFLVDRIDLAHQAKESFEKTNPKWKVGIEMDTYHASNDDDIVIASVQSLGRTGSQRIKKFDPSLFTKIVVDEVHGAVNESFYRVLSYFGAGPDSNIADKILIGVTATPNRSDGRGLSVLFDDIAVNYNLPYMIKNGWLTDIELIHVSTGTDISSVKGSKYSFNEEELSNTLNNPVRNGLILKSYLEHSKNENAIVFASSVQHAHALTEIFNNHEIPAFCIEANTDRDERIKALDDFKRGRIKVLMNYGTLTTGFDAPETSTIILGRPVKSDLLLQQIIGRGLRPSAFCFIDSWETPEERRDIINNSIKPSCKIIDFEDTIGEHRVVSVPSLFGLSNDLKNTTKSKKFFEEVVEPIEATAKETGTPMTSIVDISELDTIVKNRKMDIKSIMVPEEIESFSDKLWLRSDSGYEIVFPKERKTLMVEENMLGSYDLLEYNSKTKTTKHLQSFKSLSGAISVADRVSNEYVDKHFNIEKNSGVTEKQATLLKRILRGGVRVDKNEIYPDTKEPVLYYRKTGEKLHKDSASVLLSRLFAKK